MGHTSARARHTSRSTRSASADRTSCNQTDNNNTANRRCQLRVKPHEVVWHKQAARRIFSFTFVWLCAVGCVLLAWLARLHLVKLASQLRGLVHEPQIRRMHTCQGMQDAAASDKVPKQAVRFKTATSQACHLI